MPNNPVPVTLADILERRSDRGLTNDEIVAVLSQGVKSLELLIENARTSCVYSMGLSMESMYFFSDGSLQLKPLPFEILNERFLPPEYEDEAQNGGTSAAQNLDKGVVMSTPEVYSLLNLMTIRDPAVRFNLPKVVQMTQKLVQTNCVQPIGVLKSLFNSISGNEEYAGSEKLKVSEINAHLSENDGGEKISLFDSSAVHFSSNDSAIFVQSTSSKRLPSEHFSNEPDSNLHTKKTFVTSSMESKPTVQNIAQLSKMDQSIFSDPNAIRTNGVTSSNLHSDGTMTSSDVENFHTNSVIHPLVDDTADRSTNHAPDSHLSENLSIDVKILRRDSGPIDERFQTAPDNSKDSARCKNATKKNDTSSSNRLFDIRPENIENSDLMKLFSLNVKSKFAQPKHAVSAENVKKLGSTQAGSKSDTWAEIDRIPEPVVDPKFDPKSFDDFFLSKPQDPFYVQSVEKSVPKTGKILDSGSDLEATHAKCVEKFDAKRPTDGQNYKTTSDDDSSDFFDELSTLNGQPYKTLSANDSSDADLHAKKSHVTPADFAEHLNLEPILVETLNKKENLDEKCIFPEIAQKPAVMSTNLRLDYSLADEEDSEEEDDFISLKISSHESAKKATDNLISRVENHRTNFDSINQDDLGLLTHFTENLATQDVLHLDYSLADDENSSDEGSPVETELSLRSGDEFSARSANSITAEKDETESMVADLVDHSNKSENEASNSAEKSPVKDINIFVDNLIKPIISDIIDPKPFYSNPSAERMGQLSTDSLQCKVDFTQEADISNLSPVIKVQNLIKFDDFCLDENAKFSDFSEKQFTRVDLFDSSLNQKYREPDSVKSGQVGPSSVDSLLNQKSVKNLGVKLIDDLSNVNPSEWSNFDNFGPSDKSHKIDVLEMDFFADSDGTIKSAPSTAKQSVHFWEDFENIDIPLTDKNEPFESIQNSQIDQLSFADNFGPSFDQPGSMADFQNFDQLLQSSQEKSKSDEILEKLMPLAPEDFSQPKSHAPFLATHRKHHSWRCEFCSPRKRQVKYLAECQIRRSLPNKRRLSARRCKDGVENCYVFYDELLHNKKLTYSLPKNVHFSTSCNWAAKNFKIASSDDGAAIGKSINRKARNSREENEDDEEDNLFGSFENLPVVHRTPPSVQNHAARSSVEVPAANLQDQDTWPQLPLNAANNRQKAPKPDSYAILSARSLFDEQEEAVAFGDVKKSTSEHFDESVLKTISECEDDDVDDVKGCAGTGRKSPPTEIHASASKKGPSKTASDIVAVSAANPSKTVADSPVVDAVSTAAQKSVSTLVQNRNVSASDADQGADPLSTGAVPPVPTAPRRHREAPRGVPLRVGAAAVRTPSFGDERDVRLVGTDVDADAELPGTLSRGNSMRVKGSGREPEPSGILSRGNSMRIKSTSGSIRTVRRRSVADPENKDSLKNQQILTKTNQDLAKIGILDGNFDQQKGHNFSGNRQPNLNSLPKKSIQMSARYGQMVGRGPEFLFNSRQPSIRLKAPVAQKQKKLFRHLMEKNVLVVLLNGQRVDVACRTDSTAENIFESVSVHTNLNERHFFGLTVLRDGEHFFMEPEQKLDKFAPPNWRSHSRHVLNARILFTLFLRVKYYPITLDFVKTEQTLHHIYLQLRRDILDERLQCDRKVACELAGLALQSEYGDFRPDTAEYFALGHYMPDRHFCDEIGEQDDVKRAILEGWSKNSGMESRDAEIEYVKLCQTLREYGIHFHRLYRTKPSLMLTPSPLGDPDTGTPLWIGIMPRGIVIFEEKGGDRVPVSQHPWHLTATLQFDHKRFVICPQTNNLADGTKFVYYSDDYKKSMYFVNFAAGQHKFCMKMRTWAATLPMDSQSAPNYSQTSLPRPLTNGKTDQISSSRGSATETDSGISREASPDEHNAGGILSSTTLTAPRRHKERAVDADVSSTFSSFGFVGGVNRPTTPRAAPKRQAGTPLSFGDPPFVTGGSVVSPPSGGSRPASLFLSPNDTISASLNERLENATSSPASASSGSDFDTFAVSLVKDHRLGLGLTLVDGEIEKMAGVYVRSITPGGPAHTEGNLRIADRVIAINGVSLEGKNRHDAVEMVRCSSDRVEMGILRLRYVYSSTESIENSQKNQNGNGPSNDAPHREEPNNDRLKPAKLSFRSGATPPVKNSTPTGHDDLLYSPPPDPHSLDLSAQQDGQNSMLWLNDTSTSGGVSFYARTMSSLDGAAAASRMYAGLNDDDDEEGANDQSDSSGASDDDGDRRGNNAEGAAGLNKRSSNEKKAGPKKLGGVGVSNNSVNSVDGTGSSNSKNKKYSRNAKSSMVEREEEMKRARRRHERKAQALSVADLQNPTSNDRSRSLLNLTGKSGSLGALNAKDWTENLHLDSSTVDWKSDELDLVNVSLHKNESGGLGIQVAGGKGQKKVYVKSLVSEPAVSCRFLQPGDQLASINEVSTRGLNHHEVVVLLKNAKSPVHLGLLRAKTSSDQKENADPKEAQNSVETLDIMLEKPTSGSLGLSLARPPNSDGIYVRVITPGSVAASDGRLKAGDRLWTINGDSVAQGSPTEVVEKLKAAQGFVKLVVKRETKNNNGEMVSVS